MGRFAIVSIGWSLLLLPSHLLAPSPWLDLALMGWLLVAGLLGLLNAALLLGALVGLGMPGDTVATRRSRRVALIGTTFTSLAVLFGIVLLDAALLRDLPRGARLDRFDAAAWHAPEPGVLERRTRMLGDLLERVVPTLDVVKARALLGEDGVRSPQEPGRAMTLSYVVAEGSMIDVLVLDLEFDAAGRYVRYRLRPT